MFDAECGWKANVTIVDEDTDGRVSPTGAKEAYVAKYVAVASGHHAKPSYPDFPGQDTFTGSEIEIYK